MVAPKLSEKGRNDAFVGSFLRHVIPIFFSFQRGKETKNFFITSFVLSIYDEWVLVTAGHCITDVKQLLDAGYELVGCNLVDSMGVGAKHKEVVPFDYVGANAITPFDDPGYDYGIIFVREIYRKLLEANGVEALTEEVWDKQPTDPDYYALIGVPDELTEATYPVSTVTTTMHLVERLEERPDGFEETEAPTFYGKISLGGPLTSIRGMSGGPIFSFAKGTDGRERYWLHAVQSTWVKPDRHIAARLMKPFAQLIRDIMVGKHPALLNGAAGKNQRTDH
jgi:hypothetical protein